MNNLYTSPDCCTAMDFPAEALLGTSNEGYEVDPVDPGFVSLS